LASSRRDVCSNSRQNFIDLRRAFPSSRHSPNMIAQLSNESSASRTRTPCVTVVALVTSSTGVDGTAPCIKRRIVGAWWSTGPVGYQERDVAVVAARDENQA